jgi:hypothetical protein
MRLGHERRSPRVDQERRFPISASDSVNIDRSAQMILVRYQDPNGLNGATIAV